jgi:glycosyltransferase involved in cell wall biosynthesis
MSMYKGRKIGVAVPAYNEELFIEEVIRTMPAFVDRVYVVDDGSVDGTRRILTRIHDDRLRPIFHGSRRGAGGAMLTGYKAAVQDNMDIIAVMAGDGQMDPAILDKIIDPVADGVADYSKGNRLSSTRHWLGMPPFRLLGNLVLTGLVKVASGYWKVADPLNGYTSISRSALERIPLDSVARGYEFETDLLVKLNVNDARVVNVPMPSRYRGEKSKLVYSRFILRMVRVLAQSFAWRIWTKYLSPQDISEFQWPPRALRELPAARLIRNKRYAVPQRLRR